MVISNTMLIVDGPYSLPNTLPRLHQVFRDFPTLHSLTFLIHRVPAHVLTDHQTDGIGLPRSRPPNTIPLAILTVPRVVSDILTALLTVQLTSLKDSTGRTPRWGIASQAQSLRREREHSRHGRV